jgi:transposase
MKTLPVEFRHRVIALTAQGRTSSEIAEILDVSAQWVRSIKKLHDSGQPLEPKSRANKRRSLAQREGERIRAQIKAKPSTTLEDLKRELKLNTSISNLWNALQELKLSLKKNAPCR